MSDELEDRQTSVDDIREEDGWHGRFAHCPARSRTVEYYVSVEEMDEWVRVFELLPFPV